MWLQPALHVAFIATGVAHQLTDLNRSGSKGTARGWREVNETAQVCCLEILEHVGLCVAYDSYKKRLMAFPKSQNAASFLFHVAIYSVKDVSFSHFYICSVGFG